MNAYLAAFLAGLMVGVIYFFIGVRSPAPPLVALVGLLGMVLGEAVVPHIRDFVIKTRPESVVAPHDQQEETK